jgi:hypothetical protein
MVESRKVATDYTKCIPLLVKTPCSYSQNRKEQVVLTRCHIVHSGMTHNDLFNSGERPECIPGHSNYPLMHVLIQCIAVAEDMQTFYNVKHVFTPWYSWNTANVGVEHQSINIKIISSIFSYCDRCDAQMYEYLLCLHNKIKIKKRVHEPVC